MLWGERTALSPQTMRRIGRAQCAVHVTAPGTCGWPFAAFVLAAKVLLSVAPVVEYADCLSDRRHWAFDENDQGGDWRRAEARRGNHGPDDRARWLGSIHRLGDRGHGHGRERRCGQTPSLELSGESGVSKYSCL